MICQQWMDEIVERARSGELSPSLSAHLAECAECSEEWEAQLALSGELGLLREAAAEERSSEFNRARLMNEYARLHARTRSRPRFEWVFAAAAAAVVVLAVALSWRSEPPAVAHGLQQVAPRWQEDSAALQEFDDISGESGFVAVPYAAPLAKGEFVRVVRTELYAAALGRMGMPLPVNNGQVPADVVLGEDDLPRAVRLVAQY